MLNSYPASMVNFIWFADGKLLKFYHCSHKYCPKQLLSCICGDSLTFVASSKTVHQHTRACEMVEFLARKTPNFMPR